MKKFTRLTPFKMQVVQSFPFIDEDFDALTNYELLCKVVDYLNTTVENVNNLDDDVVELATAFNNLKDYVDNYFDNLDVQEEVNNKIDAMVTDGSFATIVNGCLTPFKEDIQSTVNTLETDVTHITHALANNREYMFKSKVIAHRGCDKLAPENSIPAFEYVAKVGGYWGCETDVQRTYDGVFIIMHDDTVDRTTDGTGRVDELLYSTIENLHIDAGNYVAEYSSSDLKIPTLTDYLEIMKMYGIAPVIEIKPNWDSDILEDLLEEIEENGLLYDTIFMCYYSGVCQKLRALNGQITIQLLTDSLTAEQKTFCVTNKIDIGVNGSALTKAIVKELHALGLKVTEFLNYGHKEGVDFLITEDITRLTERDEYFQSILVSRWEMDQIKKYGIAFNGQLTTFIRRGISTGEIGFPKYFQSTNTYQLVCYNLIPSSSSQSFYYKIPVGYDMRIYVFRGGLTGTPYATDWITGDGEEGTNANVTYLRNGYIVLMFRKSDTTQTVNYRDIEYLRHNVSIWWVNK